MVLGLGVLRLAPAAFWAMTPKELGAALGAVAGPARPPAPPSRSDIAQLMRSYPDRPPASIHKEQSFQ